MGMPILTILHKNFDSFKQRLPIAKLFHISLHSYSRQGTALSSMWWNVQLRTSSISSSLGFIIKFKAPAAYNETKMWARHIHSVHATKKLFQHLQ